MDILAEKLASLGLELPASSKPGGSYESVNIRGNLAFVSIQFPIRDGQYFYQGRFGNELTAADGYKAMQLCALNVVSQIHEKIGWEKFDGINHIDAYYQAAPGWDEAPHVVDGASDLFLTLLGEKGKHARAIVGVHSLPRNFSAGLTTTLTLTG